MKSYAHRKNSSYLQADRMAQIRNAERWQWGTESENHGGASRARTDDLIVANDALSQLSYSPVIGWEGCCPIILAAPRA